jgi:hypothetical protein
LQKWFYRFWAARQWSGTRVWCFFQVALLGGYGVADLTTERLRPGLYVGVYAALLAA